MNRQFDPFFRNTASMLTVHNLPYMGAMTGSALDTFELPPAHNTILPAWAGDMALPLGLLTADSIVAVSPGYSKEILTEEFGSGLQTFLRTQSQKISGILNGLDITRWNPSTDRELPANFSPDNLQNRLINKSSLQKELGLEVDPNTPLLAMVTRMDPQKGVDLAIDAFKMLLQSTSVDTVPFQAVFLGTGNPILERAASQLEQDFPNKIRARILYSEPLSRHIYAGADLLLMPSRYEPCGLSQMIAMRYGCIPIARSTGGLSDTIQDPSDTDESTGFLFKPALAEALADATIRGVNLFRRDPNRWQSMQIRGMRQDFSWDRSAIQYYERYKRLLEIRMDQ
jgi:starch synthase